MPVIVARRTSTRDHPDGLEEFGQLFYFPRGTNETPNQNRWAFTVSKSVLMISKSICA
jgi:hypothetical protein